MMEDRSIPSLKKRNGIKNYLRGALDMHMTTVKIGRNASCPCGSGGKYKKCCLHSTDAKSDIEENKEIERARESQRRRVKRIYNSDVLYLDSSPRSLKISALILDLSNEYLENMETDEQRKSIIHLACLAWNLSLLDEKDREIEFNNIVSKLNIQATFETQESLKIFLYELIEKKYKNMAQSIDVSWTTK